MVVMTPMVLYNTLRHAIYSVREVRLHGLWETGKCSVWAGCSALQRPQSKGARSADARTRVVPSGLRGPHAPTAAAHASRRRSFYLCYCFISSDPAVNLPDVFQNAQLAAARTVNNRKNTGGMNGGHRTMTRLCPAERGGAADLRRSAPRVRRRRPLRPHHARLLRVAACRPCRRPAAHLWHDCVALRRPRRRERVEGAL